LLSLLSQLVWNLPKNCTDEVQAVDAGFGRLVRLEIGRNLQRWLETDDNVTLWCTPGALPTWKRRVLMVWRPK
jgi:hypothetical protein|tara:strand:+ start:83 stop:301 length:219 start_codon:yes stop_codon:yes gene_type:complete